MLLFSIPFSSGFFPPRLVEDSWKQIEPRHYERKVDPFALIKVMALAFVLRVPSQEAIIQCLGKKLGGIAHASTLSYALRDVKHALLARALCGHLAGELPAAGNRKEQDIAIDSMPVMVSKNQRTDAEKYNNKARGCGVLWEVNLDAPGASRPARILKIMHGGWNDTSQVRGQALEANGPTYLADRGFYSRETLNLWLTQEVRFIMRAKVKNLAYDVVQATGEAFKTDRLCIEEDAIVDLKWKGTDQRIRVRLVRGWLGKEDYILVAPPGDERAGRQLCESYRRRDRIEKFHRFVKETLGLAHLYSFQKWGLELLIHVVFLAASALFLFNGAEHQGDTVARLHAVLKQVRKGLGLLTPWKRNTCAQKRSKRNKRRRYRSRKQAQNH